MNKEIENLISHVNVAYHISVQCNKCGDIRSHVEHIAGDAHEARRMGAKDLHEDGWRLVDNNGVGLFCPECILDAKEHAEVMKTSGLKLPKPIPIKGDGTSLYDKSDDTYNVTEILCNYKSDDGYFAEIQMFGTNLGKQYTDELIEEEVREFLVPVIESHFGWKILEIGWSESGMQPRKGWSFDVSLIPPKRNFKKKKT